LATFDRAAAADAAADDGMPCDEWPDPKAAEREGLVEACEQARARAKRRAAAAAETTQGAGSGADEPGPLPRLLLWSGHDSTLHALLAALGHEQRGWAPFAASLALELWRGADGREWVRALYDGAPLQMTGGWGRRAAAPPARLARRGGGKQEEEAAGGPTRAAGGSKAAVRKEEGEQEGEDGGKQKQWRRSTQVEARPRQQIQVQPPAEDGGGGSSGGGDGGGGSSIGRVVSSTGGWVELAELRQRLHLVLATDDEKYEACFGKGGGGGGGKRAGGRGVGGGRGLGIGGVGGGRVERSKKKFKRGP
jgi:hypothetical protein